jgi:signal transduction histidine kinase
MRKRSGSGGSGIIIEASVGKHLAFAPVAFAVTEGPRHKLVYANAVFRSLQQTGEIGVGPVPARSPPAAADLTPVLDRVFRSARTERDEIVESAEGSGCWSCTVWPVPGNRDNVQKLVIEVRNADVIEGAKARQREVTERLLLGALREQDAAREAEASSDRAHYLAKASRDLSLSLDESATRDTVRRLALPRPGTWCIVDVVESNGAIHRLSVVHPDPAKRELARRLEEPWPAETSDASVISVLRSTQPTVITPDSGAALMRIAHGEENLQILREIGFGSLLAVPLIVRARVQGAITFVSPEGDPPFTPDEITLAVDVAARCAMALDNARLYREADALKLAAELANKSKSEFLGGMSHELRTPLNAIGGFTELLDMEIGGPVTDEQRVSLARIKANQQHLLGLITEILNFVRIESGRMEYRTAEVGLPQTLREVAEMLSSAISEKGITIHDPGDAADCVAWADPDRVRQILVNLVMNAVKYATGNSIMLSCAVAGDMVFAQVADAGPGIPPEKLESIFEPFVQLTVGLADRRGGVGLGLAISRDLARAMGGDLTVESTVGVGSRFTLFLPRARLGGGLAPKQPR